VQREVIIITLRAKYIAPGIHLRLDGNLNGKYRYFPINLTLTIRLPKTTIVPLQRAQNAAARLVARLGLRDQSVRSALAPCTVYSIASLTSSAYLCHPTWSTVSPPQLVSVTVDDFGPQAANATSSREHDSNLASAVSPLLVRQLGTAFRHQFKN